MRILIDILHPAHVHFFRNFRTEMLARGHEICVTARAKDRSLELLDGFDIPHTRISTQRTGAGGMAVEMLQRTGRLLKEMRGFGPNVMTGIMGPSIAMAGALRRVPAVVFYDTEFATQTNRFVYPLAHSVCTPDSYQGAVRGTHRVYPGYHELAYLHPNRFRPDPAKLSGYGVSAGEPYFVVRFVSWQAVHDRRERGLTDTQQRHLIERLEVHGRVLVSSEGALPDDLASLGLRGPVTDIHHLLAHAQLVVGESATMSSEAAVLGVPAVFIATTGRGYTDDEERRYGLVRHFKVHDFGLAVETVEKLVSESPREFGQAARRRLLDDKIDVTEWMVDYFETEFAEAA